MSNVLVTGGAGFIGSNLTEVPIIPRNRIQDQVIYVGSRVYGFSLLPMLRASWSSIGQAMYGAVEYGLMPINSGKL